MFKLLRNNTNVLRIADNATIPDDARNSDRQEYQRWLDAGNTPAPADPPPPPSQDELDAAAANTYANLTALKGMTPAQVQDWVAANVTNLAQAQDAIATLAIAVSILARRL